ncbi:hypothetical protein P4132_22510 [Pseudomonas aeruginosa]|nr:hypothetical protein [Pseudomonas aeruginosa]
MIHDLRGRLLERAWALSQQLGEPLMCWCSTPADCRCRAHVGVGRQTAAGRRVADPRAQAKKPATS